MKAEGNYWKKQNLDLRLNPAVSPFKVMLPRILESLSDLMPHQLQRGRSMNSDGTLEMLVGQEDLNAPVHIKVFYLHHFVDQRTVGVSNVDMMFDSIISLLENNIVTFVKTELKRMHKVLSQHKPPSLQTENEDVMVDAFEEEMRNSKEAFEKITLNFLRRMKQEELADRLQS
ncbi:hypothetical protein CCH79_00020867, partial [Gambusia affinis]